MELDRLMKSGALVFVNLLREVNLPSAKDLKDSDYLRPIFDIASAAVLKEGESQSKVIVILEDITSLLWIGFSQLDISRFCRAIRALCLQVSSSNIS
jgi:hypothetical protein